MKQGKNKRKGEKKVVIDIFTYKKKVVEKVKKNKTKQNKTKRRNLSCIADQIKAEC